MARKRRSGSTKATSNTASDGSVSSTAEETATAASSARDVRTIAFYLPQFHPIPENDRWWEPGFTEWSNVTKAKPLFEGHAQPRYPTELGYYDLRVPETRRKQAALAREYGIDGFCYYYYWFDGKRLLERPLNDMLEDPLTNMPFCICWANETWSRRWDGSDSEVLMQQSYSVGSVRRLLEDLIPLFSDSRYIRVDGKPLVMVYRPDDVPGEIDLPDIWRATADTQGIGELYICAALTFGETDPRFRGYDAAVEFPPHSISAGAVDPTRVGLSDFDGKLYDFAEVVANEIRKPIASFPCHRSVMTGWDNSPRRGNRAHVFLGADPALYELWLAAVCDYTRTYFSGDRQLVFINAWNEWAEGTYLEPDRLWGRAYLESTKRAREGAKGEATALAALGALVAGDPVATKWLGSVALCLRAQRSTISALVDIAKKSISPHERFEPSFVLAQGPMELERPIVVSGGIFNVDRIGAAKRGSEIVHERRYTLPVNGWHFIPMVSRLALSDLFVVFISDSDESRYYGSIVHRHERTDVAAHYSEFDSSVTLGAGFAGSLDLSGLPSGRYRIALAISSKDIAYFSAADLTILAL